MKPPTNGFLTNFFSRTAYVLSVGIFVFFALATQPTFGYIEIAESNEVVQEGNYKFGGLLQGRLSDGGGANVTAFVDGNIREELSWRGFLGGGNMDFYAGGSAKWVPIPDYKKQPAIGGKVEVNFGRAKSNNTFVVRAVPIVSKKFAWQEQNWVPYAGLPLGVSAAGGKSDFFANLAAGTEVKLQDLEDFEFNAEIGIGLTNSFSYLSIGVTYLLDSNRARR